MRQRTGSQIGGWSAAFAAIVIVSLVPVLWIISLSFKDPSTIGDGSFFPSKWTWPNYSSIFKQGIFTDALRNSIGIALIATVIAVVIAAFAAYAIARLNFPGKTLLLAASLGIAMFPPISLVGPLYNLWRNIGLYDSWPGLILPYMTFALPLSIYTLSAFFREIPWELEQAAQVDGATPFQAFARVIAPLAAPGIFTTAILVFIFCWNDFVFATSLTSTTAAQTVPAAIATFPGVSQFSKPIGSIAAAAVVVTIPMVLIVLLFQRRIVAGLTARGAKGEEKSHVEHRSGAHHQA